MIFYDCIIDLFIGAAIQQPYDLWQAEAQACKNGLPARTSVKLWLGDLDTVSIKKFECIVWITSLVMRACE
jgi:hypothetical protein